MKILYFVKTYFPTEEQLKEAKELKAFVRNALAVEDTSPIEKCDFVAGEVPKQYSHIPFVGTEKEEKIEQKKLNWKPKKEVEK